MKNWKTTVGGILAAIGGYLVNSQTGALQVAGQVLAFLGTLFMGYAASDASANKG
jgi:hypothetical protein